LDIILSPTYAEIFCCNQSLSTIFIKTQAVNIVQQYSTIIYFI